MRSAKQVTAAVVVVVTSVVMAAPADADLAWRLIATKYSAGTRNGDNGDPAGLLGNAIDAPKTFSEPSCDCRVEVIVHLQVARKTSGAVSFSICPRVDGNGSCQPNTVSADPNIYQTYNYVAIVPFPTTAGNHPVQTFIASDSGRVPDTLLIYNYEITYNLYSYKR